MNNVDLVDLMIFDGLWESFYGYHMGITAENLVEKYGISREEQDELGALSHQRARKAIADGLFKNEIAPVVIPQRKGDPIIFDTDERPMETSVEKMAKLRPAFKKDGTVTAGNASGINDGAAALLLMSDPKARELGLKPLVRIKTYTSAGVEPAFMGIGPVPAARKILKKENLSIDDFDTIELNEAFAAQYIGCERELGLNREITNVNGSGIGLGHPVGATGCRIMVTLLHGLKNRGKKLGLATLCGGGGVSMACALEMIDG